MRIPVSDIRGAEGYERGREASPYPDYHILRKPFFLKLNNYYRYGIKKSDLIMFIVFFFQLCSLVSAQYQINTNDEGEGYYLNHHSSITRVY